MRPVSCGYDWHRPSAWLIAALHARLSGRRFDILFVNAGTTNANQDETIAETSTEEFTR
jgi:hypothetical protein